jgi:hypothetical protein
VVESEGGLTGLGLEAQRARAAVVMLIERIEIG